MDKSDGDGGGGDVGFEIKQRWQSPALLAWDDQVKRIPLHFRRAPCSKDGEEDMECVDLCEWLPNRVPPSGGKGEEMPSYLFKPISLRRKEEDKGRKPAVDEICIDIDDIPFVDGEGYPYHQEISKSLDHFMALTNGACTKFLEKADIRRRRNLLLLEGEGGLKRAMGNARNFVEAVQQRRQKKKNQAEEDDDEDEEEAPRSKFKWEYTGGLDMEVMMGHQYEMAVIGAANHATGRGGEGRKKKGLKKPSAPRGLYTVDGGVIEVEDYDDTSCVCSIS